MAARIFDRNDAQLSPVHPGEILLEEFMKPLGLTAYSLAARLHVPRTRIERLARCEVSLTPDTALRLSRAFSTTEGFWMALQANFDLADPAIRAGARLEEIEPIRAPEAA
ncbi:HigA family addiction module antitoxin [Caulobacter sp. S45]|uniref:HigA family addiction module antitoxin n=1 Tax=Caulobacter sp. S45 TaxID=1641861 RepID=UPI001576A82F|nr:HigA family addiction module antitoxin [Caulobacter sp. S45]